MFCRCHVVKLSHRIEWSSRGRDCAALRAARLAGNYIGRDWLGIRKLTNVVAKHRENNSGRRDGSFVVCVKEN